MDVVPRGLRRAPAEEGVAGAHAPGVRRAAAGADERRVRRAADSQPGVARPGRPRRQLPGRGRHRPGDFLQLRVPRSRAAGPHRPPPRRGQAHAVLHVGSADRAQHDHQDAAVQRPHAPVGGGAAQPGWLPALELQLVAR